MLYDCEECGGKDCMYLVCMNCGTPESMSESYPEDLEDSKMEAFVDYDAAGKAVIVGVNGDRDLPEEEWPFLCVRLELASAEKMRDLLDYAVRSMRIEAGLPASDDE